MESHVLNQACPEIVVILDGLTNLMWHKPEYPMLPLDKHRLTGPRSCILSTVFKRWATARPHNGDDVLVAAIMAGQSVPYTAIMISN